MDDTMSELERLLNDIAADTGVQLFLKPQGGSETCLPFRFKGKEFFLYVKGEDGERAARLVRYILENRTGSELPERGEHLKSILLGEGGSWNAFRYITKYNIKDGPCYCIDLLPERRHRESAQHVERCIEGGEDIVVVMDNTRLAVIKFKEDGENPYEFAQFLARSLYEELGIRVSVGIGCEMKSFTEIALSYHQAATAVRMSGMFGAKGEVHSYREYLLVKMLEDVPKSRLKEYFDQFQIENAAELFEDEEMTATTEEFFRSSLNLSEAARNLFMHRNTLTYRLDKIERATGLDIRKFSDAVTYRIIAILYKLLQA